MIFWAEPLFLHHKTVTMSNTHDYDEEIQKIKNKDFTHNWVSSSAFLFYLQVFCIVAFVLGGCYMLYTKSYDGNKKNVPVPENTLYTPKYK